MKPSGDIISRGGADGPVVLSVFERILLKRLIALTRLDLLDVHAITRSIDDVISNLARSTTIRPGSFVLGFTRHAASWPVAKGDHQCPNFPKNAPTASGPIANA
jgi:hypothetical protein